MSRALLVAAMLVPCAVAQAQETPVPAELPTTPATSPASLPGTPLPPDEEPPFELSLPTQADEEAWRDPGFRLQLGAGYGALLGVGGPPDGRLIGAVVRAGPRLDEDWSLLASFQYAWASKAGGLSGLRFAGTLDPTLHVGEHLELAVGVGFGGLVEGNTGRADPDAEQRTALNDSYTWPSAAEPLPRCVGVGAAVLTRASWMIVLGPTSSTGLSAELDGQWTGCVDDLGHVEPDTAQPIVRRQWWPHVGGTLSWMVAWR